MSIHKIQTEKETIFFITVTCYNWLPLFEITNFYDAIYNWFNLLKQSGNDVAGYVIMPNHFHALIYVNKESVEINKLVANGKRFMAYEIVKRLKAQNKTDLLKKLQRAVSADAQGKGKIHEVFEPSFDCKPCYDKKNLEQKLDYIHRNPCSGKWNLAVEFTQYKHSSAAFYEMDFPTGYPIMDFRLLDWL